MWTVCPVENRATTTLFFQRHLTIEVKKCIHLLSNCMLCLHKEIRNIYFQDVLMIWMYWTLNTYWAFSSSVPLHDACSCKALTPTLHMCKTFMLNLATMALCIVFNCNYKAFAYLIPNSDLIHHLHLTVIKSYRATNRYMTSSSRIIQTTLFKEWIKKICSVVPDCSPELLHQSWCSVSI